MGDSIAKSLDLAILTMSTRRGWTYYAAARDACSLVEHWLADDSQPGPVHLPGWEKCYAALPTIHKEVRAHHPNLIIATDRWLTIGSISRTGQHLFANTEPHVIDTEQLLEATALDLTSDGATLVLLHIRYTGCNPQPNPCTQPAN